MKKSFKNYKKLSFSSKNNTVLTYFTKIKKRRNNNHLIQTYKKTFFYKSKLLSKNLINQLFTDKGFNLNSNFKTTIKNQNNILRFLLGHLLTNKLTKTQISFKHRTLLYLFHKIILFNKYNNFYLISLIKNFKNLPYSILIVSINRYFRFWMLLQFIFSVILIKFSKNKLLFNSQIYLKLSNLNKNFKLMNLKNLMKFKLWKLKTSNFKLSIFKYENFLIQLFSNLFSKKKCFFFKTQINTFVRKKQIDKDFLKWFFFYKNCAKSSSIHQTKFLVSVFKPTKKFVNFKEKLKFLLWKLNRKLHSQNSFQWIFKKYWLLVNSYKQSNLNWRKKRPNSLFLKTSKLIFCKNAFKRETDVIFYPKSKLNGFINTMIHSSSIRLCHYFLYTYYLII